MTIKNAAISRRAGKWFDVKNRAETPDAADIYIYDHIDSWDGVSANDLIDQIRDLKAGNITVHLNSPGGDAFEGLTIMNALKKHESNVTIEIDGMAASAGSIIAMAGDEIVMSEGAMMMIHQPWTGTFGNAKDLRQQAEFLDKLGESLAQIYANRTNGDVEEWSAKMDAETWFNASEALEVGLADRVTGSTPEKNKTSKQESTKNDLRLNHQQDLLADVEAVLDQADSASSPDQLSESTKKDFWDSLIKVK